MDIYSHKLENLVLYYSGRNLKELEKINNKDVFLVTTIDKDSIDTLIDLYFRWEEDYSKLITSKILDVSTVINIDKEIISFVQSFLERAVGYEKVIEYRDKIKTLIKKNPLEYSSVDETNEIINNNQNMESNVITENGEDIEISEY